MNRKQLQLFISLALVAGLVLGGMPSQVTAAGLPSTPRAQQIPAPQGLQPASGGGQGVSLTAAGAGRPAPVALQFDPHARPNRVDAPPLPAGGLRPQAATFVIDFVAAGSFNALGDQCLAFPAQAIPPFEAAAAIWASLIDSPVTIRLEACWASLPAGVLGHSSAGNYFRDFTNAPATGTWYPVALASSFFGSDLDPVPASKPFGCTATTCPDSNWDDISIAYANAFTSTFYYGTDGLDGGKTDFESVVLHEMGHGLGFAGSVCVSGSTADWGCIGNTDTFPASYDRFTFNGASPILGFPHNSASLLTALTSGNVTFNGAHAQAANGGAPAPLYAPATWQGGSSYSHLAEVYNGTPNALMTFSIGVNEVLHSPGPVTLGILNDVGWTLSAGVVVAAPSGLTAVALSTTQVQLGWTSNGAGETGFLVERSPNGSSGWTALTTVPAPASGYTDATAAEGTHSFYRVSEVFPGPQNSSPSNTADAITPLAAPTGLTAAPASPTQINLTWTNHSTAATAYTVERSPNGSGWAVITTTAGLAGFNDTGLVEGTLSYYRVTATNAVPASSVPSNVANALTPLLAASGLLVTPASPTQLNLTWTNNSAAATAYTVERSPNGSSGWTTLTTSAGLTGYNNLSLTDGTRYYYRVTATNALPDSSAASPVANGVTLLAPASGVSATALSSTRVDLAWTNNSATATAYTVERSPNGSSGWSTLTTTAGLSSFSDTTLAENTTAFYRVSASDALGASAPIPAAGSATTYLNAPTALLAAPVLGAGQIRIQWNDASAAETGYQLQSAASAGGPWTDVTPSLPAGTTSFVWTTPNGTYFFQVRALGSPADSLFSGPVSATLATGHLFIPAVR
jgi:fibronectin type 3 domain-containing protein